MTRIDHKDPMNCKSKEELKTRLNVYVRDKSLLGIKVTFQRVEDAIVCTETGDSWTVGVKKFVLAGKVYGV
jgi:hypothetical protein